MVFDRSEVDTTASFPPMLRTALLIPSITGLLQKFENHEERPRVGALTVIKHLLNLPTKTLSYRLEEITKTIHSNLGKRQLISSIDDNLDLIFRFSPNPDPPARQIEIFT